MKQFTNLYPVTKTLRFELKPIGKTKEHIERHGLLTQDEKRAEDYVKVKKIIDRYHKDFIENVLERFKFGTPDKNRDKTNCLEDYFFYYSIKNKSDAEKKDFEEVQANLRSQIVKAFEDGERYNNLFKKELIQKDLISYVTDEMEKELIRSFSNFTTYFTGFHENRKNMYSAEAKSTAIAYRMIHENLPRFIDNISVFEKVAASHVAENFDELYKNFEQELNVLKINEIFSLDYFSEVLTQRQINLYNAIIGGKSLEDGTKIKGLNEYINLYNQQQKERSARLPRLKPLYKQILSDRVAISWLPDNFGSDEQLLEAVESAYQDMTDEILNIESEHSLEKFLQSIGEYDTSKIYIRNDKQLTDISQKAYGHWSVISNVLLEYQKKNYPKNEKKNESDDEDEKRLKEIIKRQGSFSIAHIDFEVESKELDDSGTIPEYFAKLGAEEKEDGTKILNHFVRIESAYANSKDLLNTPYPNDKRLVQDEDSIEKIKSLLDAIKDLQKFVKPLLGDGTEAEKDEKFYGELTYLWGELNKITPLYNKVRNYLTGKPYSTEKIKLNFENSSLLNGWDLNKETDNTSVILRKDGLYYLAIMNKKNNKVFDAKKLPNKGVCYEKMEYKFIKDLKQMVPKCTTKLKDVKAHFLTHKHNTPYVIKKDVFDTDFVITKEVFELNNRLYNKKPKFNIEYLRQTGDVEGYKDALNKWIRFCLRFLSHYKSTMIYDISSILTDEKINSYELWDEFTSEINPYLYGISFRNVSVDYVNSLVDEGKVYLFQIYNKDFSPYSKGIPNMHTLYFKMLFDERNLADVVYKLNGQAEVFYRKASISNDRPTHPANVPIDNKNKSNSKKQSLFEYDLIKDKHYTVDKFQFHVPITLNFKGENSSNINQRVNEYIKKSDDLHIIGIDRGERHLLYVSVIDMQGRIKEQYSLNEIVNTYNGNNYTTNYHDLLQQREDERMNARKSWKTIESIKELKEGYLSQVVHKISELMVKYNAIVVLEDLNMGFKRSRQKVESSVYQKFEKMLIEKLNYLVDKKKDPEELGGVLKAYQLTNKFESFSKPGKQSGFMFYVPAWNTSNIDPVTGFVNLLNTRYENVGNSSTFFSKFDSIRWNKDKEWFEFTFDYVNFGVVKGAITKWTVCTCGERIENVRDKNAENHWVSKTEDNLTKRFEDIFTREKIDYKSGGDLREAIVNKKDKIFYKDLLSLLKLTLQMRNSIINGETDYLRSPVADANGEFFDSRIGNSEMPVNADANGAYNIARKGLWIIKQIKEIEDMKKLKLAISNQQWLEFAQTKPYAND